MMGGGPPGYGAMGPQPGAYQQQQQQQQQPPPEEQGEEQEKPDFQLDNFWLIILGTSALFAAVMVAYGFFCFYHLGTVIFLTVPLLVPCLVILAMQYWPYALPRALGFSRGIPPSMQKPTPVVLVMMAVVLGIVFGLVVYGSFGRPSIVYAGSRIYKNAVPSAPAASYADGGRIVFADEAKLSAGQSVGYYADDANTYCVAAIRDAAATPRVEFWAIGINCCGFKGEFTCGAAKDPDAKGGLVVLDKRGLFPQEGGGREYFELARKKAEATFGLPHTDDALYVRWSTVADVRSAVDRYRSWAWFIITLLSGAFAFAAFLLMGAAITPIEEDEIDMTLIEGAAGQEQKVGYLDPRDEPPAAGHIRGGALDMLKKTQRQGMTFKESGGYGQRSFGTRTRPDQSTMYA
jgi:hypothetical protein